MPGHPTTTLAYDGMMGHEPAVLAAGVGQMGWGVIFFFFSSRLSYLLFLRPKKKILVFRLTRPTLFFCADPAIFIAFQKKIKKIFIPTNPKMFQKIGQKA